jgi:hypothetical protein
MDLIRINSAYCEFCKINNDSENAYCKITENSIFLNCGRNSKGVAIGHWYNDYKTYNTKYINKGTSTDDNYNTNILNNIISEMKEYLSNLENKYNKLKEEFNLLNNIHSKCNNTNSTNNNISIKKYTKDVNFEMWQKYYK